VREEKKGKEGRERVRDKKERKNERMKE